MREPRIRDSGARGSQLLVRARPLRRGCCWVSVMIEMDELYASLMAELASGGMTLPVTMELTLVAHFYERLADHAFQRRPPGDLPRRICARLTCWAPPDVFPRRRRSRTPAVPSARVKAPRATQSEADEAPVSVQAWPVPLAAGELALGWVRLMRSE